MWRFAYLLYCFENIELRKTKTTSLFHNDGEYLCANGQSQNVKVKFSIEIYVELLYNIA